MTTLPEDMRERVSNLILDYDTEYGSPIDNLDELIALLQEVDRKARINEISLAAKNDCKPSYLHQRVSDLSNQHKKRL